MIARDLVISVFVYLLFGVYISDKSTMLKCHISIIESDRFVVVCISSVSNSQLMLKALQCNLFHSLFYTLTHTNI